MFLYFFIYFFKNSWIKQSHVKNIANNSEKLPKNWSKSQILLLLRTDSKNNNLHF